MTDAALGRTRLVAQGLITRPYERPVDVAIALGAMQGQDLPGVLASVALRTTGGSLTEVFDALNAGELVRGYPMRGTVFLMPASTVVWTTQLCVGPAVRAARARRAQLGLMEGEIARAREVALGLLEAGPRSRGDLFEAWQAAGIPTGEGRGYHVLFSLIADTDLVYGPWNGTDQDVASVRQWLPRSARLDELFDGDRISAVASLLLTYLTSHGPATIRDFAWWTKLPLGEIRAALPSIREQLSCDDAPEPRYWRAGLPEEVAALGREPAAVLLLPGFDEFILGYQDRTFAMTPAEHTRLVPGNNGVFKKSVVVGGLVKAVWSRGGRPGRRTLAVDEFVTLSPARLRAARARYDAFPWTTS